MRKTEPTQYSLPGTATTSGKAQTRPTSATIREQGNTCTTAKNIWLLWYTTSIMIFIATIYLSILLIYPEGSSGVESLINRVIKLSPLWASVYFSARRTKHNETKYMEEKKILTSMHNDLQIRQLEESVAELQSQNTYLQEELTLVEEKLKSAETDRALQEMSFIEK